MLCYATRYHKMEHFKSALTACLYKLNDVIRRDKIVMYLLGFVYDF